jgi:hypothetical protein
LAPGATGTPPTTDRRDPFRWLAAAVTLVAIGLAIRQPWSADFGMHAATVERLRASFTDPGNPLVDADTPSAYYSPYTLLLAVVARVTGLSAVTVLWLVGPLAVVLLLVGLRAFVRTLTDRPLAPTLALVFLLLLWGVKHRVWSGFLSLWGLPLVMAFPSTVALGLTLLLWAGLARPVRWPAGLGLGVLAATVALIHPFTGLTAGLGILALRPRRAWLPLGVAAGLVLCWPYWSFAELLSDSGDLDAVHRSLYDRPWLYYGLAAVALPALWLRWRRDRLDPLVLLFVSALAVVAVGGITGRYALGRCWPAVLLAGQLALAVELAGPLPPRLARVWRPATVLACLVGLVVQAGNLLYLAPPSALTPGIRGAAHMYVAWPDYSWLNRYVRPGEVVLVPYDYYAVRTLPAYGVRTVAPAWPDPFLPDEARRWADVDALWNPATDPATRAELLARYHVRWVLAEPGAPFEGGVPVAVGPRGERLYAVP